MTTQTAAAHMSFWILRQTGKTWPSCAPEGYEVLRSFTHKRNAEKWAAKMRTEYAKHQADLPIVVVGATGYSDLGEKVQQL